MKGTKLALVCCTSRIAEEWREGHHLPTPGLLVSFSRAFTLLMWKEGSFAGGACCCCFELQKYPSTKEHARNRGLACMLWHDEGFPLAPYLTLAAIQFHGLTHRSSYHGNGSFKLCHHVHTILIVPAGALVLE